MDLTPEEKKQIARQYYQDSKDFQSKFFLTPEAKGDADKTHITKEIAITNLKHNPKIGIDEPGQTRAMLKALEILKLKRYFLKDKAQVLAGFREKQNKDGTITQIPVFRVEEIEVSLFPKSNHNYQAQYINFLLTASARNGHRVDKAISNKFVQENTLIDKTEVKSRFGFGNKKEQEV